MVTNCIFIMSVNMGGQGMNLHLHQMPVMVSSCLGYSSSYLLFQPGLVKVRTL